MKKNQKQLKDELAFGGSRDEAHNIETTFQEMVDNRFKYERNWHENNFFDDGFHYRFISNETRQVIDYSDANSILNPKRAIPKASRQIRGVVNLLLANRPTPVAYPETMLEGNYSSMQVYEQAVQREYADVKNTSIWLLSEWDRLRFLPYHLPFALLLAAKQGVSFIQAYPDTNKQKIKISNYDAFDIVLPGEITDVQDSPFIIKACPQYMRWIWNHPYFSEQKYKVQPDNLKAASQIKNHYLKHKYGNVTNPKETDTAIVKEAYIKVYVDKSILSEMAKQKNGEYMTSIFQEGDVVIKQIFVAGGETLYKTYLPLSQYPFVDFRYEPGAMYQTPLLDRFKSPNKVLDNIVSRLEKNVYSLSGGKYWRRKGEGWEMDNAPYGQVIESVTPPQPIDTPTVPGFVFDMIGLMTSFIEEQGVSTTALAKIPSGVRSGNMLESLKESEYSNLTIPLEQVKDTVKRTAELMTEIASRYYTKRQKVNYNESGSNYEFDIIGQRGADELKNAFRGGEIVNTTILKPNRQFKIEIESGMGHTQEGKRQNAMELTRLMADMANQGLVPLEAVKEVVNQLLKSYQFGATADIMKSYEKFVAEAPQNAKDRMTETKIAVLEVLKDAGLVGKDMENMQVNATKVGVVEAAKDLQQTTQPTE